MLTSARSMVVLLAAILMAAGVAATGASAGEERVAGHQVLVIGHILRTSDLGLRVAHPETLSLKFRRKKFSGAGWSYLSGVFSPASPSGTYEQNGRRIHFQADAAWLRDQELAWEKALETHLEREGFAPDFVSCGLWKANLKGRSKHGMLKFKSTYKFRCTAKGDFGKIEARARVKFRGKGELFDPPKNPIYHQ